MSSLGSLRGRRGGALIDIEADPDEAAARPEWVTTADGLALELLVPAGLTYRVVYEVRLGSLGYRWEEGLTASEGGVVSVPFEPPPEAFLDDLALDYLTDLRARVIGSTEGGSEPFVVWSPPGFLAWPHGPVGGCELWDQALVDSLAPNGVVSATARASVPAGFTGRVLAPIDRAGPPEADPAEDGDG